MINYKKILVTGAAGFIGFHLVIALLKRGYVVIGIDNINDYYDVNLKYARLLECGISKRSIKKNILLQSSIYSNYYFQKLDLVDIDSLTKLFKRENFDVVINLAAQAGVRYSIDNPHVYIQSNLVGFVNILECCRYHKIKNFLYASSSSVYGNNSNIPFSEDNRVDYPVSLYAATKKSNELIAHVYSHLYNLPTTGLRFFTVYGPWGRPDMSPFIFAESILKGKPIKVFNNGDMLRDFTYIDDIIEGVIRIMNEIPGKEENPSFYRLFNIGNSQPVALMDFITTIEQAIGKKAKLEMYPMQPGDVKVTYADISKLKNIIHFKPETSLPKGVKNFIEWLIYYKEQSINRQ